MNPIFADLHSHTTCSDGVYSPKELVDMAIHYQLKALAICDHDALDGIDTAIEAAGNQLEIVPSVELSCEWKGRDIHILGHFVNHKNPTFKKAVDDYRDERTNRAKKMVQKLNEIGVALRYEDVIEQAGKAAISRAHIGRALLKQGFVSTHQEAFEKYIGEGGPALIPKYKLTPKQAFELVRNAGGLPFWAHPARMQMDEMIPQFVDEGLAGLEVFHPNHDEEDNIRYLEISRTYDLLISGGSDFHGLNPHSCLGSHGISQEQFANMKQALT